MSGSKLLVLALLLAGVVGAGYMVFGTRDAAPAGDALGSQPLEGEPSSNAADVVGDGATTDPSPDTHAPDSDDTPAHPRAPLRVSEGDAIVRTTLIQAGSPLAGAWAWVERANTPVGGTRMRTGADGRVTFARLDPGEYRLAIEGETVPWDFEGPAIELAGDETKDLGSLDVPVAAGLRGRVVLAGGGGPVAGAELRVHDGPLGGMLAGGRARRSGEEHRRDVTDTEGRFELRRQPPGRHVLLCDKTGFKRHDVSVELAAGVYRELPDIELEPGKTLRGIVVEETGTPISGAGVTPEHVTQVSGGEARYYAAERRVRTDAQGRFELAGQPERARVAVEASGFEARYDVEMSADSALTRIVLARRRGISGRVVGTEGYETRVWLKAAPNGRSGAFRYTRESSKVDSEGRFHFDPVAAGLYELRAHARGFGASEARRIEVSTAGESGIELRVVRGADLVVHVLDEQGQGVRGARVSLRPKGADSRLAEMGIPRAEGEPRRVAESDVAGVARIAGTFRGAAILDVEHEDYVRATTSDLLLRAGEQLEKVILERGGFVEGRCLDASGSPLAGIGIRLESREPGGGPSSGGGHRMRRVRMRWAGASNVPTTRSDDQGLFRFGPHEAGAYRVVATRSAGEGKNLGGGVRVVVAQRREDSVRKDIVVEKAGTTRVSLRFPLPGTIEGRVSFRGQPVAGARVFAKPKDDSDTGALFDVEETKADDEGHFSFGRLPSGVWDLSAKAPEAPIASRAEEVTLTEGGTEVRFLEIGGCALRGVVVRPDGDTRQVSGLSVLLGRGGARREVRRVMVAIDSGSGVQRGGMNLSPPGAPEPVKVGAEGAFEIRFVPAGKWVLRVRGAAEETLSSQEVTLREGQALDLGEIRLRPTFPVALRVLDSVGDPVAIGTIELAEIRDGKPSDEPAFRGLVRGGKCSIRALAPGRYRMRFRAIQMKPEQSPRVQEGELVLADDGGVSGSELRLTDG